MQGDECKTAGNLLLHLLCSNWIIYSDIRIFKTSAIMSIDNYYAKHIHIWVLKYILMQTLGKLLPNSVRVYKGSCENFPDNVHTLEALFRGQLGCDAPRNATRVSLCGWLQKRTDLGSGVQNPQSSSDFWIHNSQSLCNCSEITTEQ